MQTQTEALPQSSPYELQLQAELWQYEAASAGLVRRHGLLRSRALNELHGNVMFDSIHQGGWDAYCAYTEQLPAYTGQLMQAARYRLGAFFYGQDATVWVNAYNSALDHGQVPATLARASSPLVRRAMHAALDEAIFHKTYEAGPPDGYMPSVSSPIVGNLIALATDGALPDRLAHEAGRWTVSGLLCSTLANRLPPSLRQVGSAVLWAQGVAATGTPEPAYFAYIGQAAAQVQPYEKALRALQGLQSTLRPELRYIFGEPLVEVQETIELVEQLRQRAWTQGKTLTDRQAYTWMYAAMEAAETDAVLQTRLRQSCHLLYALMGGDTEGRLPF